MESQLSQLGLEGAQAAASALSTNPDDYSNNPVMERLWAVKAMKYAETHMKILQSSDAKELKLTKYDEEMCEIFHNQFGNVQISMIDVESIKSPSNKALWRDFCNKYENLIEDFNFATLLRIDVSKDYSEDNTIIVPRAQFLAIETARNKSGLNSVHHKTNNS